MIAQSTRLDQEWDWLIITDAGRFDVFSRIVDDHLRGDLAATYNGGHSFTATWFADHFDGTYDIPLFHGGHPIWSFKTNPDDYDEREHFSSVPNLDDYYWDSRAGVTAPDEVNRIVREHDPDGAVIRYLQPHNPFRHLPDVRTKDDAKKYDSEALREAYTDNYRWVLNDGVADLLPDLEGTVIVTADHGTCLGDCGQYLHHTTWEDHDHLTTVPWFEVER